MPRIFLTILLLAGTLSAAPQAMLRLELVHLDPENTLPHQTLQERTFPDTLAMKEGLQTIIQNLQESGYLFARIDSLVAYSDRHAAYLFSGPRFSYHIRSGNIEEAVLRQLRLEGLLEGKTIPFDGLEIPKRRIVSWYENHGYPFARVSLENVNLDGDQIFGELMVTPMEYVVFDTLELSGEVNVHPSFLANHTGIRPGAPYSERIAARVADRVADLPFLRVSAPPVVRFPGREARIAVPVVRRPANRFDGIAGLTGSGTEAEPYRLTGQLNLKLVNALERGETFDMNWQGLGHGTQRLELSAQYPYIFSTPLITGLFFSLHKQDTSYISLRRRPEFSFSSPAGIIVKAFADWRSTDLLNPSRYAGAVSLPAQIDTRVTFYGMELLRQSPGYAATFREGTRYMLSLAAGSRNIRKNPNLDEALYQGIALRQTQVTGSLGATLRQPLGGRFTWVSQLDAASLLGDQLFENELFRIGGFASLKGFDEQSVFASSYSIITQEVRYFTGELSFLSLLFNAAWFEKQIRGDYHQGWPWGIATGISLQTAPGILSVYYALGKQPGIPMSFRNAKLHFGFISLF
jgi:hypothetical protein